MHYSLYGDMLFWSFPYIYCDRSNWNTISADSRAFIDDTHNRGGIMARTVIQKEHNSDDEVNDSEANSEEEDIGIDDH
jgi:hypothetical protein